MNKLRQKMIDARGAMKEGRRYHAFYRGSRDCRAGRQCNPYPTGSELARCWEAGWKYAESEMLDAPEPPLCRFDCGGQFVGALPEGQR